MYILGINSYHADSSACIIHNGIVVAAIEEERLNRIKHWAGFPIESIKFCLLKANISINDVDHIAVNTDHKANFVKKIKYVLGNRASYKFILDRALNKHKKINIRGELKKSFVNYDFQGKVHYIEHHLSHIASSHIFSPFEKSISMSIDGFGDFSSSVISICSGSSINVRDKVYFPHSLGIFYQAMTQFLGFHGYGDEYKVMGLAPYGEPTYVNKLRNLVTFHNGSFSLNLKFFKHHKGDFKYEWSAGSPKLGMLYNRKEIESLLELKERSSNDKLGQIHMDLAHSIQMVYEEVFFNMLNHAHKKYNIDNLTLSGGCAMNSVANGKINRCTNFKNVYIPPAAGDAGGSIGSAALVFEKEWYGKRCRMEGAYLGPSFDNKYHEELIRKKTEEIEKSG